MSYRISIEKYLNAVSKRIVEEQDNKGIKASGDSAKSLEVQADANSGTLTGAHYFKYQVQGRGPTVKSGQGLLRKAILKWLQVKSWSRGFDIKKQTSLSYAISKRIHERGTLRGRSQEYPGLGLSEIEKSERPKLLSEIGKAEASVYSKMFKVLK